MDEARTLAQFDHPQIVRVHSAFEANNTGYMVMGFEAGETLQARYSRDGTVIYEELSAVVAPILEGIGAVHAARLAHRDIKPSNILLREDDSPVLLDFGSARRTLGVATQTVTALVSRGYSPIEQYSEESSLQGPWTDIYGAAAIFYHGVAGKAPPDPLLRSQLAEADPIQPASGAGRRIGRSKG